MAVIFIAPNYFDLSQLSIFAINCTLHGCHNICLPTSFNGRGYFGIGYSELLFFTSHVPPRLPINILNVENNFLDDINHGARLARLFLRGDINGSVLAFRRALSLPIPDTGPS